MATENAIDNVTVNEWEEPYVSPDVAAAMEGQEVTYDMTLPEVEVEQAEVLPDEDEEASA